jgi:hypothetical protein
VKGPGTSLFLPAELPADREKDKVQWAGRRQHVATARQLVGAIPGRSSASLPARADAAKVLAGQGLSRLEPQGFSFTLADKNKAVIKDLALDTLAPPAMAQIQAVPAAGQARGLRLNNFDVGVALVYHNSWLLNNETHNSFWKGSLISSDLTFKKNMGLILNYHAGSKNLISTEFHLAKNGQEYRLFRDGGYNTSGLELTYYKVYVQYQHQFLPDRTSPVADLTLKAGLYGAVLHDKQGDLRVTGSRYSNHDYGVRLALGQEKKIGFIIVGYGASVERGLTNIFLGSGNMPARFDKTYNLNWGPYLNLRYRLHPGIRRGR